MLLKSSVCLHVDGQYRLDHGPAYDDRRLLSLESNREPRPLQALIVCSATTQAAPSRSPDASEFVERAMAGDQDAFSELARPRSAGSTSSPG